jgi:hypothetical protein
MFRELTSPDGVAWRVEVDWMARRIRNPFRRSLHAARERFEATRRARRARKGEGRDWADAADVGTGLDELVWVVVAIVVLFALFFLFVWVAPVVWAVLLVLVEFFFVTIAAVVILVWRTMLRRPWRVVARRVESETGDVWTHEVVGYRAARRLVRETADGLAQGRSPFDLGLVARP